MKHRSIKLLADPQKSWNATSPWMLLLLVGVTWLGQSDVLGQEKLSSNRHEAASQLRAKNWILEFDSEGFVSGITAPYFDEYYSFGDFAVFERLTSFNVDYAGHMHDQSLTGIAKLKKLQRLRLRYSDELTDESLAVLSYLPNLEELTLINANSLINISSLSLCRKLKRLRLESCEALDLDAMIDVAPQFGTEQLEIVDQDRFGDDDFKWIAVLPALRSLTLENLSKITDEGLKSLGKLPNLKTLQIRNCAATKGEFLSSLTDCRLEQLAIWGEISFFAFSEFPHPESLVRFSFQGGSVGRKRDPSNWMTRLINLEEFSIDSNQFTDDDFALLEHSPNLRRLKISSRVTLEPIHAAVLSTWKKLETLQLANARDISPEIFIELGRMGTFRELRLDHSKYAAENLVAIFDCSNLRILSLEGCSTLNDENLSKVTQLTQLDWLDLNETGLLTDATIENLSRLPKLTKLRISDCKSITGSGFDHFTADSPLTCLVIERLPAFTAKSLEEVLKIKALQELRFSSEKITEGHFRAALHSHGLRILNIERLGKIDELLAWQIQEASKEALGRPMDWQSNFWPDATFGE